MVLRIALVLAALSCCGAARAAVVDCRDCQGDGEVTCAACEGNGRVLATCPECDGGKVRCGYPKCTDGRVPCRPCRGRGFITKIPVGVIEPGNGTVDVPCPPTLPCPKCKGTTLVDCKACKKKGTAVVECFSCEGRKKERCLPCYGTGKVGEPDPYPEPAPPPANQRAGESRPRDRTADIREAIDLLEKEASRAAKLDEERRAVLEGIKRLNARIDALARKASEERELRVAAEHLARRWSASRRRVAESAATIEKSLSGVLSRQGIARLERLESDIRSGKAIDRLELEQALARARKDRQDVAPVKGRLSGLIEELGRWEKEVAAFEARHDRHLAEKELERKRIAALGDAFRRVAEKIPAIAEKAEMPPVECDLLASRSRDALSVEIGYFDESASVSETAGESVPGDGGLARVPAFISEVFRECPGVERIRLSIDATGLTETGHEKQMTIQTFTMERGRWKELVSGKHGGEWRTLLEKSRPTPAYPRPPRMPEGTWPIIVLIGICFLGTAGVFAVRARMLS
jgi:hypothetical protein